MAINKALLDKYKKNSCNKNISVLSNSIYYNDKTFVDTGIPALNLALSAKLDGGWGAGLTMWAAPSRHFKTAFTLALTKAYMNAFDDSIVLFYDSEFGAPPTYFQSFGIDTDRVLHIPIKNIEELSQDLMKQLDAMDRSEHVVIIIDSVGNLASKKEVENALTENTSKDMTRAQTLKSLWRMVTPYLAMNDVPMAVVNHVYDEQKMHGRQIMSGGTGGMLSSENVLFISRSQEKDGDELVGYNFNIVIEKSRYIKERSRIPITVKFDGGINKWSGLIEMALETGHVVKPNNGWYSRVIDGVVEDKKYRKADTDTSAFWKDILEDETFTKAVNSLYAISQVKMLADEDAED